MLFADQCEAGGARLLDDPIPAATRGAVVHCQRQPVSLQSFEQARRWTRRILRMAGSKRGAGTPPESAPARKQRQATCEE
jgi:hypothetical protein